MKIFPKGEFFNLDMLLTKESIQDLRQSLTLVAGLYPTEKRSELMAMLDKAIQDYEDNCVYLVSTYKTISE